MKESDLITLLSVFVLLSLMGAIARQLSEMNAILPGLSESFRSAGEGFQPAPVDASRASYNLLDGKAAAAAAAAGKHLTAQECFERDFAGQSEKTGKLAQWTNNYEHESPESCTAPLRRAVYS